MLSHHFSEGILLVYLINGGEPLSSALWFLGWMRTTLMAVGLGFIIILFYFIESLLNGEKATSNPWQGTTLEWKTSSPPPLENFINTPQVVCGPYERLKDKENG